MRFIVKNSHMDLIEDGFHSVIQYLIREYNMTPADVRAERAKALKNMTDG